MHFHLLVSKREGPRRQPCRTGSKAEKQHRFDALVTLQNEISAEKHAKYVGTTQRVLADGESGDTRYPLTARTNGGRLVHLSGGKELIGQYINALITDSNTWSLFGEPAANDR